jgi:hypothetical protein
LTRARQLLPGFVARLFLIYALMIAPWPGLEAGYAALYRSGSNALSGVLGLGHHVSLHVLSDEDRASFAGKTDARALALDDTKIVFRAGGQQLTVLHSTWYSGYIPTALLIALMLATPLRWPGRLRALGWGLLIVSLYLALRMGATFIAGGAIDPFHWLPAPDFRRSLFSALSVTGPGSGLWYVVPLLTWILLVHRRVYQEVVVGVGNGPTPSEPPPA